MTIGVMMIVKNEAHILGRVAESLRGQIDYWTIVDTGSTDATMAVARDVFDFAPGQVLQSEWNGFGPCRNVALKAAEPHTDWLLSIDADETLEGAIPPLGEDVEVVEAEQHFDVLRFWLPRLVRSHTGAHWVGRAHEYLSCPSQRRQRTSDFYIAHHADGGTRPDKLQRELYLLEADYKEDPSNPRTAFYLARTYDDMQRDLDAIAWYRIRLDRGGWSEELFYARYRLGVCRLRQGQSDQGCGALWRAWGEQPHRAEPLVALAEHYRQQGLWALAWQAVSLAFTHCGAQPGGLALLDGLFVDASATAWRAAYEGSIAAWYVGEQERGLELTEFLLDRSDLPPEIAASVTANATFYGANPPVGLGKT
jgi:glycosyltransferase involved in cell wall biosynthesis